MPDAKDIAIAVLGASLGLAALLIVFMGFLLAYAETFPPTTPDRISRRFKVAAKWGLAPTVLAVMEALAAYAWLIWRGDQLLWLWGAGFALLAVLFLVYAVVAVLMIA
jgi:hypothetical protein